MLCDTELTVVTQPTPGNPGAPPSLVAGNSSLSVRQPPTLSAEGPRDCGEPRLLSSGPVLFEHPPAPDHGGGSVSSVSFGSGPKMDSPSLLSSCAEIVPALPSASSFFTLGATFPFSSLLSVSPPSSSPSPPPPPLSMTCNPGHYRHRSSTENITQWVHHSGGRRFFVQWMAKLICSSVGPDFRTLNDDDLLAQFIEHPEHGDKFNASLHTEDDLHLFNTLIKDTRDIQIVGLKRKRKQTALLNHSGLSTLSRCARRNFFRRQARHQAAGLKRKR